MHDPESATNESTPRALGNNFRTIVVADAASFSVQLLRQGSEAYNPATFFACSRQEFTMKHHVSRRHFTKLAIGAAIVGFNPDERSWVTQSSNTARPFDRAPKLASGELTAASPSEK